MLNKNNEKGKCPFRNLKPCSEECVFYRKGVRFNETKSESYPFEECAINIIADNLEAMHNRTFMMQNEVAQTKHVIALNILREVGKADKKSVEENAKKLIFEEEKKYKEIEVDKNKE
jgi:hypothetical protein